MVFVSFGDEDMAFNKGVPPVEILRAKEGFKHVSDIRLDAGNHQLYFSLRNIIDYLEERPRALTLSVAHPVGIGRMGTTSKWSHSVPGLPVMQHFLPSRFVMSLMTEGFIRGGGRPLTETRVLVVTGRWSILGGENVGSTYWLRRCKSS